MLTITLPDGGRELTFEIRRLSAVEGEALIWDALRALGAGLDFQDVTPEAVVMALAKMDSGEARKLLDTLLGCCQRKVDQVLVQVSRGDCSGYITNPLTLIALEIAAATENFGFFTEKNALSSLGFLNIFSTAQKSEGRQN